MKKKNKLVFKVGVNDADYEVQKYEKGQQIWICTYYKTWKNMLKRAYSTKYKKGRPTYEGVTACDEWYSFINFRSWMVTQDWKGKQLDKDLLVAGNKVYSPDTCVFIDRLVNSFILECTASRGEWPVGVSWHKRDRVFRSECRNPFIGKSEHLGSFNCPNQAHLAWKKRKHELACQLADIQTDERVVSALRNRYK